MKSQNMRNINFTLIFSYFDEKYVFLLPKKIYIKSNLIKSVSFQYKKIEP